MFYLMHTCQYKWLVSFFKNNFKSIQLKWCVTVPKVELWFQLLHCYADFEVVYTDFEVVYTVVYT